MAWMLLSDADFNVIAEHQFDQVTIKDQAANPSPGATEVDIFTQDQSGRSMVWAVDDSGVAINLGHDSVMIVRNATGSGMTKGQLAYINGSTGNVPTIALAQANDPDTLADVVLLEDIADGGFGYAAHQAMVTVNTVGKNEGDYVYLSASSAGTWTDTEPTPAAAVYPQHVGVITKVAAAGIIHFEIEGHAHPEHIWHGNLAGLSGDDHTQYLLIDGTRAMTGTLIIGTAETTTQSIDIGVKAFHTGTSGFIARDTDNDIEMFMVAGSIPSIGSGTSAFYVYASGSFAMYVSSSTVTFYGSVGINTDLTVSGGDITLKGGEANPANLFLYADQGDDNPDKWSFNANTDDTFSFKSFSTGAWVQLMGFNGSGVMTLINNINLGSAGTNNQIAHNSASGAVNIFTATSGTTGPSLQWYGRDHASYAGKAFFTFGGYDDTGWLRFRFVNTAGTYTTLGGFNPGGIFFVASDNTLTNTSMTIGITIDSPNATDEFLSLKDSGQIAHGITTLTETDTFGRFQKAVAASGGFQLAGFSEDTVTIDIVGIATNDNTTKGSSADGPIKIRAGKKSGTSWDVMGADANILVVQNKTTTVWHLDEDGDVWQSGNINIENSGSPKIEITGGANQSATVHFYNDAAHYSMGCNTDDSFFVWDATNGTFAIHVIPNPLHKLLMQTTYTALADGASNKHYWTNDIYFIQDSANAAMQYGITINAPATTAEVFTLKDSSNVSHGMTSITETDSFFTIQKAVVANGGVRLEAVAEAAAIQGVFTIDSYGGTADTTLSEAGRGLVEINVYEHDGFGAVQNLAADDNIVAIRSYKSDELGSVWVLNATGDTWQLGDATFYQKIFINESANTGMSIGITIHQGANTDEILAFKNTNVAHGATDLAETDTFANFKPYEGTAGGLKISSFKDADGIPLSLALYGYLAENANTTKTSSGYGIVNVYAAQTSGASVANVVADGNIFSVQCRKGAANSTVMLLDEDGDLWISGGITTDGDTPSDTYHIFGRSLLIKAGVFHLCYGLTDTPGAIVVGSARTDTASCYLDLITDTTYTTYGMRILRAGGGANAANYIVCRGTGGLIIQNTETAAINLNINSLNHAVFANNGYCLSLTGRLEDVGAYIWLENTANDDQISSLLLRDSTGNLLQFGCYGTNHGTYPDVGIVYHHGGPYFSSLYYSDGSTVKPNQPSFCATMSTSMNNIVAGSGWNTVEFDTERYDQGGDYNTGTYTFTAPRTAKYHFSYTLYLSAFDTGCTYVAYALITSNQSFVEYVNPLQLTADGYIIISFSTTVDMDANDTAYVAVQQVGGANQMDLIATNCFFSGFLAT